VNALEEVKEAVETRKTEEAIAQKARASMAPQAKPSQGTTPTTLSSGPSSLVQSQALPLVQSQALRLASSDVSQLMAIGASLCVVVWYLVRVQTDTCRNTRKLAQNSDTASQGAKATGDCIAASGKPPSVEAIRNTLSKHADAQKDAAETNPADTGIAREVQGPSGVEKVKLKVKRRCELGSTDSSTKSTGNRDSEANAGKEGKASEEGAKRAHDKIRNALAASLTDAFRRQTSS